MNQENLYFAVCIFQQIDYKSSTETLIFRDDLNFADTLLIKIVIALAFVKLLLAKVV